jgi:hypothetical protein
MGARLVTSRLHVTASFFGCISETDTFELHVRRKLLRGCETVHTRPNSSGHVRTIQTGSRGAGNDRSRHQAEPLPGADGLDLLDHEAKPASLAAASREQDKPN